MPSMLMDLVQALTAKQPELLVVGQLGHDRDLEAAVETCHPDVIVTRTGGTTPETVHRLLLARPLLRVLVLARDGREAYVHTLVPSRVVLEDVSPDEILDVLRGTGRFRGMPA